MEESDSQSMSEKYMVNSRSDDYDDSQDGGTTENEQSDSGHSSRPLREQDRYLPIANIARIMKRSIPKSGKIAKDAKECIQECVSEFISFITSEASDRCHQEKRKTINGEDILFAMSSLGFDNYIEPLKVYLQKYREMMPKLKSENDLTNFDLYDSKGTEDISRSSIG
ncbi:nuclear transcription factor Y subunit B-1 [Tetranychus urticae]|uniref:Nuclear transcription factor Y subunit beta n=1 Tax=Tetranychus urticae TaxID=32264 RepID=T1L0G0_TETUR|nr:nuclear transcription factor Y subunit B-1 [Tetranychus urticae]